jgi:hypothetical protein
MKKRKVTLLIIFLIVSYSCFSQFSSNPKKIKVKGEYLNLATGILFPKSIDDYSRIAIYNFDGKQTNIGASYEKILNQKKTTLSIYIYPAGFGSEDRLRNEYLTCLKVSANLTVHLKHAKQHPVSFTDSNYKILGLKAEITDLPLKSILSLYECGRWFFKIRITSDYLDSLQVVNLENKVLETFVPTKLVQIAPLNPKADIYFAKGAFIDSLMLGSVMGSALEKINWTMANIDSLQRASGFPGLYLDLNLASINAFVKFEKDHPNMSKTIQTSQYLSELNCIIKNGFLKEFIMDQYGRILIVSENTKFDFVGFKEWQKSHSITIDLNQKYYILGFGEKQSIPIKK